MDHFEKQDAADRANNQSKDKEATVNSKWSKNPPGGTFQSFVDGDFDFVSEADCF